MSRPLTFLAFLVALAAALGPPQAATAQDPGAGIAEPRIAVLDVQRIMADAIAAQGARQARNRYALALQEEVKEREAQFRAEEEQLVQQRAILSAEAFEDRIREFRRQVGAYGSEVKRRREAVDQAYLTALGELRTSMLQHLAGIMEERGMTLVLAKSQVIIFDQSFDVTEEVLARVNRSTPSVEFPDPDSLLARAGSGN